MRTPSISKLTPAGLEDFLDVGMRAMDRKEVAFMYPDVSVEDSVRGFALSAEKSYIGRDKSGRPLGIYGIDKREEGPEYGLPWLLTTREFCKWPRAVFNAVLSGFPELIRGYKWLFNYIHVDNRDGIRWLKWLGFYVREDEEIMINQGKFYLFVYWTD